MTHRSQSGSQASCPGPPGPLTGPAGITGSMLCTSWDFGVNILLSALVCQGACARMCVWCCLPWKENKPKANTACISTSPRAVQTSNSPGQEGFPVRLDVRVQRQLAARPQREWTVHLRKGCQRAGEGGRALGWLLPPLEAAPIRTPHISVGAMVRPPGRKACPGSPGR